MALSLPQTQAISELAAHLYDYLPGSSAWKGTYTFADAANDAGVGEYWIGGSKLPALTRLLECTLERRPGSFCRLIEQIVRSGISYRRKKGTPLTSSDVEALNEFVRRVGFKIPALWDPAFIASLPRAAPASPTTPQANSSTSGGESPRSAFNARLAQLRSEFLALQSQPDRSAAGLSLERVLNGLFELHDLEPNAAFRVVGEQIDGSFLLDSEVYLLEAKWTATQIPEADLLVFRGKVEGKSSFTRGLFISINGYSPPAIQAIAAGKQPTFVMMDGADLYRILEGHVRLDDLLRRKVRWLAERGQALASVSELFER
jgi:hypothetical protein